MTVGFLTSTLKINLTITPFHSLPFSPSIPLSLPLPSTKYLPHPSSSPTPSPHFIHKSCQKSKYYYELSEVRKLSYWWCYSRTVDRCWYSRTVDRVWYSRTVLHNISYTRTVLYSIPYSMAVDSISFFKSVYSISDYRAVLDSISDGDGVQIHCK